MTLFTEISIILVLATAIALIMRAFKQPLVVGYIATGILVGPYVLNVLHSHDDIELFSKIGISILLFIVGLGLNPDIVREVGKTSFLVGLGQVFFTAVSGYYVVRFLGYSQTVSMYVSAALTFSSTIIILKLLADRADTTKLYGKISIGILLIQDLIATVTLLMVSILGSKSINAGVEVFSAAWIEIVHLITKGAIVVVALYLISKYLLPKLANYIAGNQEVLFVFSLAWGLGMASLFQFIGFSIEIGALVAGVTLSVSPFAYEMGSRMKPLRDFFIILFFILLGAQMVLGNFMAILIPALVLSAFVLIIKPIIVFILMNLLGYRPKTAFSTGSTVAQISEFSLILISLGLSLGHIDQMVASLVTLVGIITISGSTYLVIYGDQIYAALRRPIRLLEIRKSHAREMKGGEQTFDVLIFGYDRVGYDFVKAAKNITERYAVVDFDPQSIKKLQASDVPFRYGDAEDLEFLQEIGFHNAKLVVSSIPDFKTNLLLVQYYRKQNPTGIIITISHEIRHAKELYLAGASYVVMPHFLGAKHASEMISAHGYNLSDFDQIRNEHLVHLAERELHSKLKAIK